VRSGDPVDLALLSLAASVLVPDGVLGGWSAAELMGARCGPFDAPAEVIVAGHRRSPPGLVIRSDVLAADEVCTVGGVRLTTGARTAHDLARRPPRVLAVVAVDALSRQCGFAPGDLIDIDRRHLGGRGSRQLAEVVVLADPSAESPMETRIRLALHDGGLPPPVLQHPVGPYRLDLAYPAALLGIEYDGRDHLAPERARRDLHRQAELTAAGWRVLRFPARDVLGHPWRIARSVRFALASR
jgi:very-short-patch-repair endonuclease